MHSLFWTLAKTKRATAMPVWGNTRNSDSVPQIDEDDTQDFSYDAFIQENTLDEIAVAGGVDPLDLRLKLMAPYPIATRLIETVARISGWRLPIATGRARGFAFAYSNGTWAAQVVEASQQASGIRIDRIFCAADAGALFDEFNMRARMQAAIRKALSSAVGRTFHDDENCPSIEVSLLRESAYVGSAATAALPVMPALANAIFALTGNRIRRTPLGDEIAFI
jgi:isoquinoline 1-oxidoreductase beta subunit